MQMVYQDRTLVNPFTYRREQSLSKVVGNGLVETYPDIAILQLGVVTEDKNLINARKLNDRKMNQVLRVLEKYRIESENIKTISFTIVPLYDYVEGRRIFRTYEIQNMLEVTITELNILGNLIEESIEQGVNRQVGIEFKTSQQSQYYEEALKQAVVNSKEKADAMAKVLGYTIDAMPLKIEEIDTIENAPIRQREYLQNERLQIQSGKLEIRAKVEAVFKMT
jgi:hypothetical protein